MQQKSIQEIEELYDLELSRIEKEIKKLKKKNPRVLLQFPDGMKPYATAIVSELEKRVPKAEFLIWLGSCYGACDIPNVSDKDFDLVVQFGHSELKDRD